LTSMRTGLGRMRVVAAVSVAVTVALALAGCSGAAGNDAAAATVAGEFTSALSAGDTDAACALLAQGTLDTLEQESGSSCTEALATVDLPDGGVVISTRAYARGAEAVLESDTVFLTLEPTGWKIHAAGCTQRAPLPYHCELKGD
jgi:hypothetical protein